MRKEKLFVAASALTVAISMTAYAGEWKQDSVGWWYQNDDGSYPANQWFQDVDWKWYYFNETGYMQIEPITLENGTTYTFNDDGSCVNRWSGAANETYYDYSDGMEKNLGNSLAERDYINSISGQESVQETQSYPHVLTPNTRVDFDNGTYYEEYSDEDCDE